MILYNMSKIDEIKSQCKEWDFVLCQINDGRTDMFDDFDSMYNAVLASLKMMPFAMHTIRIESPLHDLIGTVEITEEGITVI